MAQTWVHINKDDVWDNERGYLETNPWAQPAHCQSRIVFNTTADVIAVSYAMDANYALWTIGITVDGVVQPAITPSSYTGVTNGGVRTTDLVIPVGTSGVLKTVELTNGQQTAINSAQEPGGAWVQDVAYDDAYNLTIVPPTPVANRGYFIGDSIMTGSNAVYMEAYGVIPMLRRVYEISALNDSYGAGTIGNHVGTNGEIDTTKLNRQLAWIAAANPAWIWIQRLTNDYGLTTNTLEQFSTVYAHFVDAIHAAHPSVPIYCQTAFNRENEHIANNFGSGWTLEQGRQAIRDIASTRDWIIVVEGEQLTANNNLDNDGLHLTTAGQAAYAYDIANVIDNGVTPVPTANAGADKTITLPSNSVVMTGGGSNYTSGVWSQVIGPVTATIVDTSSPTTQVNGLTQAGTYQFRWTVTGDEAQTSSDDMVITVNSANVTPPTLSITRGRRFIPLNGWTPPPIPSNDVMDEFTGAFDSWQVINATGNATTDTANVQAAFDNLDNQRNIYLVGHFNINATISRIGGVNFSIICDSPTTTSFTWTGGATTGNMFYFNGVAYSRILQRCTLDGGGTNITLVYQHHDQNADNGKVFDTGNEYLDSTFQNCSFGIKGGYGSNSSFAETVIRRCKFFNCTVSGTTLGNFNALDIWFYNCHFENCPMGITNSSPNIDGAGGYHAYKCVFKNNTYDIYMGNTERISIRECYSKGSQHFFAAGVTGNPAPIVIQGNVILDTVSSPIVISNHGPVSIIDNEIRSDLDVFFNPSPNGDILFIGNKLSKAIPSAFSNNARVFMSGNTGNQAITAEEPVYTIAATVIRHTVEVTSTIQSAVNEVAAYNGQKPIVHVANNYTGDVVITGDTQLVGDNYGITITGNVTISGTATIKDMRILGTLTINGKPYFNQLQAFWTGITQNSGSSIFTNSGLAYKIGTALTVNGGDVYLFACQGAAEGTQIQLNAGEVQIKDYWYERAHLSTTADMHPFCAVANNTKLIFDGGRVASPIGLEPPIFSNTNGKLVIMGVNVDDRIEADDDTLFIAGLSYYPSHFVSSDLSKARMLLTRRVINGSEQLENIGAVDEAFIIPMLAEIRAKNVPVPTEDMIRISRLRLEYSQLIVN